MATAVAKMKAAQVSKPGADFEIVEREIPKPGAGQVRIKVRACGVCHSDVLTKEGAWPGIQYPRVPGHEVAGIIDEVGSGVSAWKKGQRVGVGWHGGQDNTCRECRRGDFRNCRNVQIPGISYDGGYQQYMVAPIEALAAMPETLGDAEAAPLLCAGITTYNALRHSGALPGDLVAVQGIGGLGHLGIQFANKFGYKVVAIGRGSENASLARKLGASLYIDSQSTNAAEELQKLDGARVILATAPSSKAMSALIDDQHQLTQVIGVVIGNEKRLAEQCLAVAPRKWFVQILFGIEDELFKGGKAFAAGLHGGVPLRFVFGRFVAWPVTFGPLGRDVLRGDAELQNVGLCDSQVLQQFPGGVWRALGSKTGTVKWKTLDGVVEGDVCLAASQKGQ